MTRAYLNTTEQIWLFEDTDTGQLMPLPFNDDASAADVAVWIKLDVDSIYDSRTDTTIER